MEKTAEIFYDNGHQAVRLPEDFRFKNGHVSIRQDQQTGDLILAEPVETRPSGDFEKLFQMLDDLGPAPEDFMLFLCDPLLEREPLDLFADEDDSL